MFKCHLTGAEVHTLLEVKVKILFHQRIFSVEQDPQAGIQSYHPEEDLQG